MNLGGSYPVADPFREGFRYFDTSRYASDFLRPCVMLLGHWHVHLHHLLDLLVRDAFLLNHLGHVHHLLLRQSEQGSGPGQGQGLKGDQSQLQQGEPRRPGTGRPEQDFNISTQERNGKRPPCHAGSCIIGTGTSTVCSTCWCWTRC